MSEGGMIDEYAAKSVKQSLGNNVSNQEIKEDSSFPDQMRKKFSLEELDDRRQNRWLRLIISGIACAIPLILLVTLYILLLSCRLESMDRWAQVVLISGTFLTFISIYGFLLTGLFRRHSQNNKEGESGRTGQGENDGWSEKTRLVADGVTRTSGVTGE